MRNFGTAVLWVATLIAICAAFFTLASYQPDSVWAAHVCRLGAGFCEQPRLWMVPIGVT